MKKLDEFFLVASVVIFITSKHSVYASILLMLAGAYLIVDALDEIL